MPTERYISIVGGIVLHTDILWLILTLASVSLAIFLAHERHNELKYYFTMLERASLDNETREADSGIHRVSGVRSGS